MLYSPPNIHSVTTTGLTKFYGPDSSNSTIKSREELEITSSDLEAIIKVLKEALLSDQVKSIELSKYPLKIFIQATSDEKEKLSLDSAHSTKKKLPPSLSSVTVTDLPASDAEKKGMLSTLLEKWNTAVENPFY